MTEPTTVSELVVIGQRRADSAGSFPSRPEYNDPNRPRYNTGPAPTYPTDPAPDPCDDPQKRREWGTDAGAADAWKDFKQDAANRGENPSLRERGQAIYSDPTTGTARLGPMSVGPAYGGRHEIDLTGVPRANILGYIHNHPGGTTVPSAADREVYGWMKTEIANAGGDASNFRMYIVGATGDFNTPYRIYVYSQVNIYSPETGPEVNPDSQRC